MEMKTCKNERLQRAEETPGVVTRSELEVVVKRIEQKQEQLHVSQRQLNDTQTMLAKALVSIMRQMQEEDVMDFRRSFCGTRDRENSTSSSGEGCVVNSVTSSSDASSVMSVASAPGDSLKFIAAAAEVDDFQQSHQSMVSEGESDEEKTLNSMAQTAMQVLQSIRHSDVTGDMIKIQSYGEDEEEDYQDAEDDKITPMEDISNSINVIADAATRSSMDKKRVGGNKPKVRKKKRKRVVKPAANSSGEDAESASEMFARATTTEVIIPGPWDPSFDNILNSLGVKWMLDLYRSNPQYPKIFYAKNQAMSLEELIPSLRDDEGLKDKLADVWGCSRAESSAQWLWFFRRNFLSRADGDYLRTFYDDGVDYLAVKKDYNASHCSTNKLVFGSRYGVLQGNILERTGFEARKILKYCFFKVPLILTTKTKHESGRCRTAERYHIHPLFLLATFLHNIPVDFSSRA